MFQNHFINGVYTDGTSRERAWLRDPSNVAEVIAEIPIAHAEDMHVAVTAAREAFDQGPWPRMSQQKRAAILQNLARLMRAHAEELGKIESRNVGKLLKECIGHDVPRAAQNIEFFADAVLAQSEELCTSEAEFFGKSLHISSLVTREPVGVAGLIVPWNSPLMLGAWKIGPCLASGNTCVLKPSPWAPLALMQLGKLANEAGIPPGVLNIVVGEADAGNALVRNPGVDRVSFTGSVPVGRSIQIANAETRLAPISLELGGKAPNIVFPDADMELAVKGVARSIFRSQGQSCVAGSRLLVETWRAREFTERIIDHVRSWKIGNHLDSSSDLGPLINQTHLARVKKYIQIGITEGAQLRYGGKAPADPELACGNYLEPTIFDGVTRTMRIWQEEIFGPVLTIMPFSCLDEAVSLANDSAFGLSANIWTRDMETALTCAHRLKTGMVWINSHFLRDLRTPFGGVKASGVGSEGGRYSLEFYTQPKMICVPSSKRI